MQYRPIAAIAAALLLTFAVSAAEKTISPEEAIALYDAGRYTEARAMLEALDADGRTTGPLLYRLAFALGRTGDAGPGKAMESRALKVLEEEFAAGGGLEVAFYLSNAYRNRNAPDRSVEVAQEATRRLESGDWNEPGTALGKFRIGKLYADQNRDNQAAAWYSKALTGFEAQPGRFPSYENWVRRYLYQSASNRGDWKTAGEMLQANLEGGRGTRDDFDSLAILLSRSGQWDEAAEAWRKVEQVDPSQANRPRYCRQLTIRARELGSLPVESLDGEPIAGLDKGRMEVILKELADRAVEIQIEATAGNIANRDEAQAELNRIKGVFVAVALEYAYQGHPIRETAFQGGYAPMIFHGSRWNLQGA